MLKKTANLAICPSTSKISYREISPEEALKTDGAMSRFGQLVQNLKAVSPKSGEFTYFICRAIHAMESSTFNKDTNEFDPNLGHIAHNDGNGKCKHCQLELFKDAKGQAVDGLWCKSSKVSPAVNQNGDAFPERELLADTTDPSGNKIKAFETFIGRGLFVNHASDDAEKIRGIILDSEWDAASKGVDLLVACDKVAFPELARQIEAGYSNDVSMGTQVQYSLCSDCGNKAVTVNDYCKHIEGSKGLPSVNDIHETTYEVNAGLNFIEISVVSTGADPKAKIRKVLASLDDLVQKRIKGEISNEPFKKVDLIGLESELKKLEEQNCIGDSCYIKKDDISTIRGQFNDLMVKIASFEERDEENCVNNNQKSGIVVGGDNMADKKETKKEAYFQGTVEPEVGKSFQMGDELAHRQEDKQMHGKGMESGSEGMHPGYEMGSDEKVKEMLQRASADERKQIRKALVDKYSYFQGTVEPEIGKSFQMGDELAHRQEDKHMHGVGMESGSDGMHPGYGMGSDEKVKEMLQRAKLRAKMIKGSDGKDSKWTVYAGDEALFSATGDDLYGEDLGKANVDNPEITNQEWIESKAYGFNLIKAVKEMGAEEVKKTIEAAKIEKTAQEFAAPVDDAPENIDLDINVSPEGVEMEGEDEEEAVPEVEGKEVVLRAMDEIETKVEEVRSAVGDEEAAAEEMPIEEAPMDEEIAPEPEALASVNEKIMTVLAKAGTALKAKKAEVTLGNDELEARKSARHKIASELYNVGTESDMIDEAHPDGGNDTVLEDEEGKIETEKEKQEKDLEVAEATPRGELVARKEKRKELVKMAAEEDEEEEEKEEEEKDEDAKEDIEDAEDKLEDAKDELEAEACDEATMIQTADEDDEATKQTVDEAKQILESAEENYKKVCRQFIDKNPGKKMAKRAEADNETKQYYQELAKESATGQPSDPEVKKFYSELTSDFYNKKKEASDKGSVLRIKRSFALANKKAQLGLIENTQEALESDVDRAINLSEEDFLALEEQISNLKVPEKKLARKEDAKPMVRSAGAIHVGQNEAEMSFEDELNKSLDSSWRV